MRKLDSVPRNMQALITFSPCSDGFGWIGCCIIFRRDSCGHSTCL